MRGLLRYVAEVLVLTAGVAVCGAYITLTAPSLLDYRAIVVAALYVASPFCWLMPLTLRKVHLALWLALRLAKWTEGPFTLWGEALLLSDPATTARWIRTALLDVAILLSGILAIRARSRDWQFLKSPHTLSIVAASTVGTAISLLLWSTQISRELAYQVQNLSHGEPYCLATNGEAIKRFANASGLLLVRNEYFVGPLYAIGPTGTFNMKLAQFHAVLAVQQDGTVRYWYWSFREGRFMPVSAPAHDLGGYACDPLTKKAIVTGCRPDACQE